MQQFGDGAGRVLVGSQSFWEGIDVPGDALQCVLIDKLPFPPPDDPLIEARGRQIEARGGDPFGESFVAEAAVSLKQGGGRLIRSSTTSVCSWCATRAWSPWATARGCARRCHP
jgi:ATP-dependent DNA helicase DinG